MSQKSLTGVQHLVFQIPAEEVFWLVFVGSHYLQTQGGLEAYSASF